MTETKTTGWPYGAGTLAKRGAIFWMRFRDIDGKRCDVTTKTGDERAARLLLAERAIALYRQRIARVEERVRENGEADPRDNQTDARRKSRRSQRAIPAAARGGARGQSAKRKGRD